MERPQKDEESAHEDEIQELEDDDICSPPEPKSNDTSFVDKVRKCDEKHSKYKCEECGECRKCWAVGGCSQCEKFRSKHPREVDCDICDGFTVCMKCKKSAKCGKLHKCPECKNATESKSKTPIETVCRACGFDICTECKECSNCTEPHECSVCGYTIEPDQEECCPLCGCGFGVCGCDHCEECCHDINCITCDHQDDDEEGTSGPEYEEGTPEEFEPVPESDKKEEEEASPPYYPEPNAPWELMEKVFSVYEIWIRISEFVGIVEMHKKYLVNKTFNWMCYSLVIDCKYTNMIIQPFLRTFLVGEIISTNYTNYSIEDINFESKYIIVKPVSGSHNMECILFGEDPLRTKSFRERGYHNLDRVCGYCVTPISRGKHFLGCSTTRESIRIANSGLMCEQYNNMQTEILALQTEIRHLPKILKPKDSVNKGLDKLWKIKPHNYTPETTFNYKVKISMGALKNPNKVMVTVTWLGLDRLFNPQDNDARNILRQMRIMNQSLVMTDLCTIADSIKELHTNMPRILDFKSFLEEDDSLTYKLMDYCGGFIQFYKSISQLSKGCKKAMDEFVGLYWKEISEPLYNKALIGVEIGKELRIKSIDFEEKVIIAKRSSGQRMLISFRHEHTMITNHVQFREIICGFCGKQFIYDLIENKKTKEGCRFQTNSDLRSTFMRIDSRYYMAYLRLLSDLASEHISETIANKTYSIIKENEWETQVYKEFRSIRQLERFPGSKFAYRINYRPGVKVVGPNGICTTLRDLDREIGQMECPIFAVDISRIFNDDFNALKLILLAKSINTRIYSIGWMAALTSLKRLRSAIKDKILTGVFKTSNTKEPGPIYVHFSDADMSDSDSDDKQEEPNTLEIEREMVECIMEEEGEEGGEEEGEEEGEDNTVVQSKRKRGKEEEEEEETKPSKRKKD